MNKKLLFVIIILLVIIGIICVVIGNRTSQKNKNNNINDNGLVLFYSPTCPHCIKVEEFLTQNKAADKIKFENRDVSMVVNYSFLAEKAKKCGITESNIGIPFLFDGSNGLPICLSNDIDIINFFKNKL